MTVTCDFCHQAEIPARMYNGLLSCCRRCAGQVMKQLIAYIHDFDRRWPPLKRPRNKALPITDAHGTVRCRKCEGQMLWIKGTSPYCVECQDHATGKVK